jgi:hypothetical protein
MKGQDNMTQSLSQSLLPAQRKGTQRKGVQKHATQTLGHIRMGIKAVFMPDYLPQNANNILT